MCACVRARDRDAGRFSRERRDVSNEKFEGSCYSGRGELGRMRGLEFTLRGGETVDEHGRGSVLTSPDRKANVVRP